MEKLQESVQEIKTDNKLLALHGINVVLLFFNFALNFAGNPALKYLFLVQVLMIVLSIILYNFEQVFLEIIILMFIEGQGRILWHYASWSRIAFDVITLMAVLKIFIHKKRVFDRKILPWPIIALIVLHLSWYLLQLFNVNAVSIFGAIAASKIYIYPIFLFLAVSISDLFPSNKHFKHMLYAFSLLVFMEMALNYFHFTTKQNHLYSISTYYYKAMKDGIFVDNLFRPFATTALPGVLAVYLFLTVGFLYFFQKNIKTTLLKWIIISLSIFTIITCQIRSALVKYMLVIAFIQLGVLFYKRFSLRAIIPFFVIAILIFSGGDRFFTQMPEENNDENLTYALNRATSIAEIGKVKDSRLNLKGFGKIIIDKITKYPLGVGPGMTGAASSINQEAIAKNPFIKKEFLWTSDNLIISFALDLGIGGIFFLSLILIIPLYFLKYLLKMYAIKDELHYNYLLICLSTTVVIIIGNWGAVGLTYNPESFIFWLFSAIGFKVIGQFKYAKAIPT